MKWYEFFGVCLLFGFIAGAAMYILGYGVGWSADMRLTASMVTLGVVTGGMVCLLGACGVSGSIAQHKEDRGIARRS